MRGNFLVRSDSYMSLVESVSYIFEFTCADKSGPYKADPLPWLALACHGANCAGCKK